VLLKKNKNSCVDPKVVISHKEDLAKYGYKANRKIKKLRNLLICW
jgi:hypothetical protein